MIGKNRPAHRILWGRFSIKLLFDVQFGTFLFDFFQSQNWKDGLNPETLAPFQISEILICFFHSKIQPEISSYTKFRTILTGNDVTIKLFDFQRILLILIIYEPYN